MTQFYLKDERCGDRIFHRMTRELYKKIISVTDRLGAKYRVITKYVDGIPVKELTLFVSRPGDPDHVDSFNHSS